MTWYYIFFLVTILVLLVRNLHNRYIQTKFKYSLYELRDKLRMKVVHGEIDPNSWLFDFYDNSLSNNIRDSYYVTLFSLLVKIVRYENDEDYIAFMAIINSELEKSPEFKEFQDEYVNIIRDYMQKQHLVSAIMLVPVISPIIGARQIVKKINTWITKTMVHQDIELYEPCHV